MRSYLLLTAAAGIAIFGAIWIYVAVAPMAFMDDEYPRWAAKQDMLNACDLGDLVVVGDSRAAVDVMPAALPVRATNIALAGTSTIETYVAIERILRCPVLPKTVVISLSASHFAAPDTFWQKSALYRFLGRGDLEDLRAESARIGDWSMFTPEAPDALPPEPRIWLYAAYFPSLYFPSLVHNAVFLHLDRNRRIRDAVLAARGQYFFHELDQGYDGIAAEGSMPSFTALPILDAYFARSLALLAAHHIRSVFMPMPINDATYDATTPDFRRGFAAYLRDYAARYANFVVPGDTMPHMANRFIGDDLSHLNPAGAAVFNRAFAACAARLVWGGGQDPCPGS